MRPGTLTAILAPVAAVAGAYAAMRSPRLEERERALAVRVRRPRGPVVDRIVSAGTDLGSMFAAGGGATVLAANGRRRAAVDVVVAASLAWGVSQALKHVVGRPRPYEADDAFLLVSKPAGTSWPSGHPAVAAAVTTALEPHLPGQFRAVGWVLSTLVAASRVYVGVHYPTDVVAGLGLGATCGRSWRAVRRRVERRLRRR